MCCRTLVRASSALSLHNFFKSKLFSDGEKGKHLWYQWENLSETPLVKTWSQVTSRSHRPGFVAQVSASSSCRWYSLQNLSKTKVAIGKGPLYTFSYKKRQLEKDNYTLSPTKNGPSVKQSKTDKSTLRLPGGTSVAVWKCGGPLAPLCLSNALALRQPRSFSSHPTNTKW